MPDFARTFELYKEAGYAEHIIRDKPAWLMQLDARKNWLIKISEPNTNNTVARQNPHTPDLKYPLKTVTAIKRVLTRDGQFLLSNQRWIGRTSIQNDEVINIDNWEMYDKPIFERVNQPSRKDSSDIISVIRAVSELKHVYTLPFNTANLQLLQDMADPDNPPSYSVADLRQTGVSPREVLTFEALRDTPFEHLLYFPVPTTTSATSSTSAPGASGAAADERNKKRV